MYIKNMNLKEEFYKKLSQDKTKINWNKNPIKMDLFLSFLTISVIKSHNNLGYDNGWTVYENDKFKLKVQGGIVNGIEYLDDIQFGTRLDNNYNNYVNPFYLSEILTSEGLKFFVNYYKDEINNILSTYNKEIIVLENELNSTKEVYTKVLKEVENLRNI
jgi:hypothetical protein